MCQRRQNSVTEADLWGVLKLGGNQKPINNANPIAISEYPEKSQ
jgi:hypothetical protein